MLEPIWLSYAGAITGAIGAVTGIAGAVMGYIAYRRSEELKALDLRLELRKSENDVHSAIKELPAILEQAKKSRQAVASANGSLGSGALAKWLSEWNEDFTEVKKLETQLSLDSPDYSTFGHVELETKLVTTHGLHTKVSKFQEKYNSMLAADDREREQIRADIRIRTQAHSRTARIT
jgi:hypothetical protein